MDDLELQPVGIGEEDGVIIARIFGIMRRRIEHRDAVFDQQCVRGVDRLAAFHPPRQMVETRRIAVVRSAAAQLSNYVSDVYDD